VWERCPKCGTLHAKEKLLHRTRHLLCQFPAEMEAKLCFKSAEMTSTNQTYKLARAQTSCLVLESIRDTVPLKTSLLSVLQDDSMHIVRTNGVQEKREAWKRGRYTVLLPEIWVDGVDVCVCRINANLKTILESWPNKFVSSCRRPFLRNLV
jgi:hypothetical protein